MVCGIYSILNTVNNKQYIGLSTDIEYRFRHHKSALIRGNHRNRHLQSSFNKYGLLSFEFKVLELCIESELNTKEKHWINVLKTHDLQHGYNKTFGGEFGRLHPDIVKSTAAKLRLKTISDEQKQKISNTLKNRPQPQDVVNRRAMSNRKCSQAVEDQIIKLRVIDNMTIPAISKLLDIKFTTVCSIIKRYVKNKVTHG